jgi:hypothetical protein
MNKLEGKYNKEERGEGFFSAMFSKQSSYDTFHCNDVKSSNEQTTAQEEVIDMQDLAPEDDNTEDPYIDEEDFDYDEDNDYREEDYDYKEVDDDDCPPQIDYIDPSAPSYNPSTMSGMFLGILILVLIPYIISLVLFLIFS